MTGEPETVVDAAPGEVYVSIDIEADGPIPGPFSMLSLGAVAVTGDGRRVSAFTANLAELPDAVRDPGTMRWWERQPAAWTAARLDPRPPEQAMRQFAAWIDGLPGIPVATGWPAGWDYMWVHWYLVRFTGRDPLGLFALDIRSYAMALLGRSFSASSRERLPERFRPARELTHRAVDDAGDQAEMLLALLAERAEVGVRPKETSPGAGLPSPGDLE